LSVCHSPIWDDIPASSDLLGRELQALLAVESILHRQEKTHDQPAQRARLSGTCGKHDMGFVDVNFKNLGGSIMPIVRLIFVRVVPEEAKNAEQIWKESWAPLMIKRLVAFRRNCSGRVMIRGNSSPNQSGRINKVSMLMGSVRPVRKLKSMRDICTEIGRRSNAIRWCSDQSAQSSRSQVFYTI
jgi:hypothetical protein